MPRSRRDIKTSVADNSVLSLLDPLHALANAIGRAVAGQVVKERRQKSETNKAIKVLDAKSMQTSVDALHAHVTAIAGMALAQLLIVHTAEARALRMSLILRLAREDLRIAKASSMEVRDPLHDRLLTTAEAASMLQTSRPHVSMLCKAGKLGEVVLTRRGRRRIQLSAIQAHLSNLVTHQEGGMSLRQAGIDAGLYDYPDGHFLYVCRGEDAAAGARKAAPAKSTERTVGDCRDASIVQISARQRLLPTGSKRRTPTGPQWFGRNSARGSSAHVRHLAVIASHQGRSSRRPFSQCQGSAMSQRIMRIFMSEPFRDYILGRVARGGYVNPSEYIRELVRRDQETQAYKRLRDLIHGTEVREGVATHQATLTGSERVTIPQEIRDRLGLKAGDKVSFAVLDNACVAMWHETLRLAAPASSPSKRDRS